MNGDVTSKEVLHVHGSPMQCSLPIIWMIMPWHCVCVLEIMFTNSCQKSRTLEKEMKLSFGHGILQGFKTLSLSSQKKTQNQAPISARCTVCTVFNTGLTPLKFNIAPEKWWLEDYFPLGPGNFSGAMLNFSVVYFHQYMVTVQPLTFTLVNTEADRLKVSDEGKLLLVSW